MTKDLVLPNSPLVFLDPGSPDFPFPGWEYEFGRYAYFVLGSGPDLRYALNRIRGESLARLRLPPPLLVPSAWRHEFPMFDWNQFSAAQIRASTSGQAVRFEKCVMSILAIAEWAAEEREQNRNHVGVDADVLGSLNVFPSIYVVDGFDEKFFRTNAGLIRPLVNSTMYIMMRELAAGLPVIYPLAVAAMQAIGSLQQSMFVRPIVGRNDAGRLTGRKRVNAWQRMSAFGSIEIFAV